MSLVPGHLWRLGKTTWQGALRDVLFARGLTGKDAPEIADRISSSRRPIVLVGKYLPPNEIWESCEPAVVPLSEVASDDVLVAAYKQHGSYRKAADALIAQGVATDRWAIARAVQRAGGTAALRRSDSSSSK